MLENNLPKLVRDNIPAIIEKFDKKVEYENITDDKIFEMYLIMKFKEEVEELEEALLSKNNLNIMEEIIDITELLATISNYMRLSDEELIDKLLEKRHTNGAFKNRVILKSIKNKSKKGGKSK